MVFLTENVLQVKNHKMFNLQVFAPELTLSTLFSSLSPFFFFFAIVCTSLGYDNLTTVTVTQEKEGLSSIQIFALCIYLTIFVVGSIGNGLVIFVTGYKMKTTVNSIWFLNLAIADFFFSFAPVMRFVLVFGKPLGYFLSKLLSFMTELNMFASIFFLTAISLDRCLCTWMIVWARNERTLIKAKIICMIVWVLSIGCSIPFVINFCTKYLDLQSLFTYRFIVGFLIPFIIITSSYVAIGVRVKHLKRGSHLRSYRLIISLVLAFFVCWFPYHIHKLCFISLNAVENKQNVNVREVISQTTPFVVCLAFLNSCLNPILYVFMCDEFKKKLKQSLLLVLETALAEDHLDFLNHKDDKKETKTSLTSC
ncbi:C3a anaphylatoxin chemotactic receptor-like [Megalobrama amblycephala]|uniref:C3a anaphylatoxin chemotactic receptor-like n=1 Tax=Megalobrama amblycephala TaxID=75352 RepID=UPI002013DCD2|nr:C3a anaphylatoxin chemotactic receptor-like [Megalobrama amblycephala]